MAVNGMMMLVTYDVDFSNQCGAKRLRKVAKICENYGVRVQNSVFEMLIDPAQLTELKNKLMTVIDLENDSVRFYNLGKKWESKIDTIGNDKGFNQTDTLIL
jgi:CRISPR-associated protein Cas2